MGVTHTTNRWNRKSRDHPCSPYLHSKARPCTSRVSVQLLLQGVGHIFAARLDNHTLQSAT